MTFLLIINMQQAPSLGARDEAERHHFNNRTKISRAIGKFELLRSFTSFLIIIQQQFPTEQYGTYSGQSCMQPPELHSLN
jgi:hypothetical protein